MVRGLGGSSRVGLLAFLCLLGACGRAGGNAATPEDPAVAPAPPPTVSVPPAQIPVGSYDTSIGSGVDANGFAILPLRSGAHRYFVNSSTGSDGNGCSGAQQPAKPLATIAAAAACIQNGVGDQVLVAEGTRYSDTLPNFDYRAGYSAQYPTVIESYDPADPLNEDKYGKATNGRRPVINTGGAVQIMTCCNSTSSNYFAIRGFDVNPGDKPDMGMSFVGSNSYVLIENNIFRYTSIGFNKYIYAQATSHIIRKNAFYGEWSTTGHSQGLFDAGTDNLVIEDNVFYHVGWKLGVSRDTDPSVGGPTMFRHSIYQQTSSNALIRRNIFIDPSATGCNCRGDTTISENVFIDNPIAIKAGLGDDYNTARPAGVTIEISNNAIFGDADINSMNPRGFAIWTGNGKQGSSTHHNLIVNSRNVNGMNVFAFTTEADFDQPSYMNYDSNLIYRWSAPTFYTNGSFPGQDFATYTNNIWDAPSSGTNSNNANASLPNPLTAAGLYTALGCTDKQTCAAQMVETPELGWGAKARALLRQAYGR